MRAREGERGVKLYRNVVEGIRHGQLSRFHEGKKGWDGSWSLRRVPSGEALSGKLTFNLINAAMSCSFFPSLLSFATLVERGAFPRHFFLPSRC